MPWLGATAQNAHMRGHAVARERNPQGLLAEGRAVHVGVWTIVFEFQVLEFFRRAGDLSSSEMQESFMPPRRAWPAAICVQCRVFWVDKKGNCLRSLAVCHLLVTLIKCFGSRDWDYWLKEGSPSPYDVWSFMSELCLLGPTAYVELQERKLRRRPADLLSWCITVFSSVENNFDHHSFCFKKSGGS